MLLTMVMMFALPLEASAASKVTAATTEKKAKTVKKGTTVVTVPKSSKSFGYIKFKAPSTKTYKFTLKNIRRYGKKSSGDIIHTSVDFTTKDSYGGKKYLSFKQNGSNEYSLWLCSQKSWKINKPYTKKVTSSTSYPTRTASIRLKKGQTVYLSFCNVSDFKVSYDLTIK